MHPTEREELARLLPTPDAPVLPAERLVRLETHLMREIALDEQAHRTSRPGGATAPKRPRRRLVSLAMPAGLAAAACAAVLTLGPGAGERPSASPEAVDLLHRIAAVAATQDAPTVRDDQYVYTLTQGTQEITDVGTDVFRRADWHAVDGRRDGLARITVLSGPSGKGTRDMALEADPNHTTYRELQELPTDPDQLYERVWEATEGQGPTHEEAALEAIGSMLRGATLLPEVDAALYRAAARIPGVTVVEHAEDAAGRTGVGLSFGDGREREVWVFGKSGLNYLGTEEVALLDIGVVDKAGVPVRS
ncbi:CU044_5270 family protein [Streptomyces sp. NPDC001595]|uniref:CU044_5270 family protein n=1 Tax=Streptomyces sp. NPDC001532 TaxID=3154520 RepID=UPI0033245C16